MKRKEKSADTVFKELKLIDDKLDTIIDNTYQDAQLSENAYKGSRLLKGAMFKERLYLNKNNQGHRDQENYDYGIGSARSDRYSDTKGYTRESMIANSEYSLTSNLL